ncbi:flagellar motor switch protein FliN [Burkholderia cepacia]|uniref:Flagellar motor switch protein FliN n=1 Tax=Burkholderia cepacia TaxID=292 RepID=A0AA88Z1N5_BURCE|nr:flagellar motor switch protein FliN [Burkholderia cepacia]KGB98884.1 flagellar motor switch protein FliN [Burkholderia cepacia]
MTPKSAPSQPLVMRVDLHEHTPSVAGDDIHALRPGFELVSDVKVTLDIRLGSAELTIKDLMALQTGSVIELDRHLGDSVDVKLNGRNIAHAEIVAVGEQFGIRITEILAGS